MEDRFVLTESVPPVMDKNSTQSKTPDTFSCLQHRQTVKIYGVFDGHGGEVSVTESWNNNWR